MNNYVIETWFPTTIFVEDSLLLDNLFEIESSVKNIKREYGVIRGSIQSVDSSHKTYDQLHTLPQFQLLCNTIIDRARIYAKELGYVERYSKLQFDNMWFNISNEGDYLFPHTHSDSVISGAFYIKAPNTAKIKIFSDCKKMITPPEDTSNPLSFEYASYDCIPGRLLLFKSDTLHGTEKQPVGEKIVVSFNCNFRPY